jgi:hypothetical protein
MHCIRGSRPEASALSMTIIQLKHAVRLSRITVKEIQYLLR